MQAGQTAYRGEVYSTGGIISGAKWYIGEAVVTGIEVDGMPMVRLHNALLPASDYVATKVEAKQQIVDTLTRAVGVLMKQIDTLKDEIVHDLLTTEAAA